MKILIRFDSLEIRIKDMVFCIVTVAFIISTMLFNTSAMAENIKVKRGEHKPLLLGIFPRRSAKNTVRMFMPLADYLSKKLGRQVKLVIARDFKKFWEGVTHNRYDIVHYNQYHYVRSHKNHGYNVIAVNEEFGSDTISGTLVVRRDSNINSVEELKGKLIVFGGGPKAMQSYIIATYLLRQAGLKPGDYTYRFTKTPPNSIFAPYYKQADAGGVGDTVLKLPTITRKIDTRKLKILARNEPLAQLPWAIKGRMDSKLAKRIQFIMLSMNQTKDGKKVLAKAILTGFKIIHDHDFNKHRHIIKIVLGEEY